MTKPKIYTTPMANIYPLYVQKAQRKGRTQEEVDTIICWLTGYSRELLHEQINADMETFFEQAPQFNANAAKITGIICGCRVETIDDPLMQKIRYLDKLIDELSKGKAMEKILRQ
jgi:hypothetical protein